MALERNGGMQWRGSIPIGIGEMLSTHITDNKFLFQYYDFIFLYDHVSTYVLSEWHATKELQTSEDNKLKEPETWNLQQYTDYLSTPSAPIESHRENPMSDFNSKTKHTLYIIRHGVIAVRRTASRFAQKLIYCKVYHFFRKRELKTSKMPKIESFSCIFSPPSGGLWS